MTTNRNYAATLRLPSTQFPMRALASGNAAGREADLGNLMLGTGSARRAEDAYRTLRNCFRWMLGSLSHFDGVLPAGGSFPALDRHVSSVLAARAENGGARVETLVETAKDDLMAFYFDVRKDALYCDGKDSPRRLAALAVTELAFETLCGMARETVPHLVAEASGHFSPKLAPGFRPPPPPPGWEDVRRVRKAVLSLLDKQRAARSFNSSLDLHLDLFVEDPALARSLSESQWDTAETLCVSAARTYGGKPGGGRALPTWLDGVWVSLRPADGMRCARSYRFSTDTSSDPDFPGLSPRDAAAVRELGLQSAG